MVDFRSRDIRGMGAFLQSRVQTGYNITFGNIPDRGPGLQTATDPSGIVYGGQVREAPGPGILLQVNRGVVLGLGDMRIQDEHFRHPGVYAVLDDAGIVHPFFADTFLGENDLSRDRSKFAQWYAKPRTRALVELRDMYETTYEAHDFLPGMLECMIDTWNTRKSLPLLVLPYRYRVERNITEPTVIECLLESLQPVHKAVKKGGWKMLTGPEMLPIGTRTRIRKIGFNAAGEYGWSGELERDRLIAGYTEEDVHEPKRAADVPLI